MKHATLVALLAFCTDMQLMDSNILVTWPIFQKYAKGCLAIYTDPKDKQLFIPECVGMDPIEFFTVYMLLYARCTMNSGIHDYGSLSSSIIKACERL